MPAHCSCAACTLTALHGHVHAHARPPLFTALSMLPLPEMYQSIYISIHLSIYVYIHVYIPIRTHLPRVRPSYSQPSRPAAAARIAAATERGRPQGHAYAYVMHMLCICICIGGRPQGTRHTRGSVRVFACTCLCEFAHALRARVFTCEYECRSASMPQCLSASVLERGRMHACIPMTLHAYLHITRQR